MEIDPNTPLENGDAFLLGYLPHRVNSHFHALEILSLAMAGADGELASRVEALLRKLPERGPEVVSCVWQVQNVVGSGLRVRPPDPPQSPEDGVGFARAVDAAFASSPAASASERRTAYALGARCGAAERLTTTAALLSALRAVAPTDARLAERAGAVRDELARLAASPGVTTECPSSRGEDAAVASEAGAAASIAARPPDDAGAYELAQIHVRLGRHARALESAVRGTPRAAIRAWREGRLAGPELMRRLVEHASWHVPCRLGASGQPEPLVLSFDRQVVMIFGDSPAYDERPSFVRAANPADDLFLTLPGVPLFRWIDDASVGVLVVDPTNDQNAPHTINYPREMHGRLRQVADEVALDLAACDWSRLDPGPLRDTSFWILISGGSVHNLVAHDTFGRPFVGLFSSEAALDAHLARATPDQARDSAHWQRVLVPGHTLFPSMAQLDVAGIMLNPSGPGRTRAFNTRTVQMLADAPS